MSRLRVAFLAVLLALSTPPSVAAPCAGFTDVDSADPFCSNVEWLKSRGVTLGCTATLYCPGSVVSRLQMAAFMNRLGGALTPVAVETGETPGTVDLDANGVVCQSAEFVATDYPRWAYVDATLSALAPSNTVVAADIAMTLNGGASWVTLSSGLPNRGTIVANAWAGISDIATVELAVGQKVRWGIKLSRGGVAGLSDISDSRCRLRAVIYGRNS